MADESAKSAAEQLSTEVDIDESTRKMDFETIKKFIREDQMTQSVTFTSIKKGSYLPFYIKKNLGGEAESWDLFSNQQMGLEVQKNLVLVMWSEVEGGSLPCFCKKAYIWAIDIGNAEKYHFLQFWAL